MVILKYKTAMDISVLRVTVVLHHRELPPRPDPPSQQCLVGSVALPASPAQGVLQDVLPGLEPLLFHLLHVLLGAE